MTSRVMSVIGLLLAISLILSAFFGHVWQKDEYVLKHMQFGPQMFYSNQISLMSHLFFIAIVISILLVIALVVAFIGSQRRKS